MQQFRNALLCLTWLAVSACIFCCSGVDVWGEVTDKPTVESLQQQLNQLQATIAEMQAADGPGASTEAVSLAPEQLPHEQWPTESRPQKDLAASFPTARLTGFFQSDAVWFNQDDLNRAALGNVQNGADFRRTRLAVTGDAWENVGYIVEMDFSAGGRPSFMDVWGEVREGLLGHNVRLGQFRHPFGMDGLTGIRELPFLERGLPFAFLPFRQIGIMTYGQGPRERSTWAVSGFRFPTDAFGGNIGDLGGYGLASRATGLLLDNEQGVLHVGGGFSYIDPSNNIIRFRNQPEVFVVETGNLGPILSGIPSDVPAFVDTGTITTRHASLFNAELGASWGSWHAQSEVFYVLVDPRAGPSHSFSGAYVHAGYLLTGEKRPYNRANGVFGRVDPLCPYNLRSGLGAWEVAGRWSYIDLNSGALSGGRLGNLTVGLNWYLNKYTKLQFNYIRSFLYSSPAVAGPIVNDSSADIVAARLQIDF